MAAALCGKKDVVDLLVSRGADLTPRDDNNDTLLHVACEGGNSPIVEDLLPQFDINCRGQLGWTPLMAAAWCGKQDVFDLLVSKGADLTLRDDCNRNVLHVACDGGNSPIVEDLLPQFDINCRGFVGWTPLIAAAWCGKKDVVDLLVSKGADLTLRDDCNRNVLHLACQGGNSPIVEYLLPQFDINCRGQLGWTPLMTAALNRKKDVVNLLVSKGADLTLRNDNNDTLLHVACEGGNSPIVEDLLPQFDINCRGFVGWTPLMAAAWCGKKDVVDLLVSKGADLTLRDDDNDTLLHVACEGGNSPIVEDLLPRFDINCRGQLGWTPLMTAALNRKKDVVDLLVSNGADLTLRNDNNDTLLHVACEGGNSPIVGDLLPQFDINCRGFVGWTPLMTAAWCGKKDVFDLLVSKGADLTLRDDDNDTLLHVACEGGNSPIVGDLLPQFDINCRGQLGWTLLMSAALNRKKDVVDLLVSKGADLTLRNDNNDTLLHVGCEGGNSPIVGDLLPQFDINCRGYVGWTPLMTAALNRKKDVVDLLVSKGADLTLRDDCNRNVLHVACEGGNSPIVEDLLPVFDINCRGQLGWTPLMTAYLYENEDVVDLLVSKGADLSLKDDCNRNVLHLACQGGNSPIEEDLLPVFEIYFLGYVGWTPLMTAAWCWKKDVVDLLLSRGADLSLKDNYNRNVFGVASHGGNSPVVKDLLPEFDINCMEKLDRTPLMTTAS
ncbi:serine/threonine-protein phosphatase 6 regulatory ankyrin repeat subunit C-like [Haliotis rubra]|uniref:serine/threonine-protein phosphatase 6 regulatory ankyrin repeat subunit C-like n=1 Tax=Haliotis rubra TaxID=36100 RepID=UPI001EE5B382|nr:serine/threonine-protein phosphatase 6 regulatory ankyrin repeat subunit C-like [Haliotis rubra]